MTLCLRQVVTIIAARQEQGEEAVAKPAMLRLAGTRAKAKRGHLRKRESERLGARAKGGVAKSGREKDGGDARRF
jgi:hypothetical protein